MQELVYLVRHGESEWNVRGVTQGQTAHPRLTARGREQMATAAARLGQHLPRNASVHVTSSDLVRAVEGATILAAALGASRSVDARLRERDFGLLQGTRHPRTVSWTRKASSVALTHSRVEAAAEVRHRAAAAMGGLREGVANVVVGHGEFFRVLSGGADLGVVDNGGLLVWDGQAVRLL